MAKLVNRIPNTTCTICSEPFYAGLKRLERGMGKYCSSRCYGDAKKGSKINENQMRGLSKGWGWNKGMIGYVDEVHPQWKGQNCSYASLHHWIARKLGKPDKCEFCKRDGLKGKFIQWANVSGAYHRNLEDWIRLCTKCHYHFDRTKGFKSKVINSCLS